MSDSDEEQLTAGQWIGFLSLLILAWGGFWIWAGSKGMGVCLGVLSDPLDATVQRTYVHTFWHEDIDYDYVVNPNTPSADSDCDHSDTTLSSSDGYYSYLCEVMLEDRDTGVRYNLVNEFRRPFPTDHGGYTEETDFCDSFVVGSTRSVRVFPADRCTLEYTEPCAFTKDQVDIGCEGVYLWAGILVALLGLGVLVLSFSYKKFFPWLGAKLKGANSSSEESETSALLSQRDLEADLEQVRRERERDRLQREADEGAREIKRLQARQEELLRMDVCAKI
ncbi:hypothetical protein KIPB_005356 [Kipferlia bialata]|uniref:Uncharacterized protein n=1 Tax=Kipferlia bialata TaxID=797122 RepID=A0A9K3CV89_9EUKA|nr:hypothetical protein KIPB_005356 [Kipferlia bialata]|eukprot:g5356.t1